LHTDCPFRLIWTAILDSDAMKLFVLRCGILIGAVGGFVSAQTTLHTTTTLVVVPTLVETQGREPVFSLTADDFVLMDNGVPQRVTLEEETKRPLSLVVLIQTGGIARGQFANYSNLETMLEEIVGKGSNRVSIVNFDSAPEAASPFTTNIAEWRDAIDHPDVGDSGAAIFDGVEYGLISQEHDEGSKTSEKDVIRDLGESNTTVYSVTFSAEKTAAKQAFKDPPHLNPPIVVSRGAGPTQGYFNLNLPLAMLLGAMRKNLTAEVANLSGGESGSFGNKSELDEALGRVSSHIRNSYILSFSPTSAEPGLHTIKVLLKGHPEMMVSARRNYWASDSAGSATNP
jgi:hypothetical protein